MIGASSCGLHAKITAPLKCRDGNLYANASRPLGSQLEGSLVLFRNVPETIGSGRASEHVHALHWEQQRSAMSRRSRLNMTFTLEVGQAGNGADLYALLS